MMENEETKHSERDLTATEEAFLATEHSCHFSFGDDNGYLFLCGTEQIKWHFAIIKRVYEKAFEVMGKLPEPDEVLE